MPRQPLPCADRARPIQRRRVICAVLSHLFFFSSRRRHTRSDRDWSSDVCSSDLNDLPATDCCPGFGSVAKYVAVSTREAALDVASMARTSTRVFVFEVMGRHAGWIAAAAGLAGRGAGEPPHIILFPEIAFEQQKFLDRVRQCVGDCGYCVIVVSEGAAYAGGRFLADAGTTDAFGHTQLGGVAPVVANMVREAHGYKYHWAVADYLQRSARHIASRVDVVQAYAVGKAAVELAARGVNVVMPSIVCKFSKPYR